jgi:hypothetical protein
MPPSIVDFHSHWGTERGYAYRGAASPDRQAAVFGKPASFVSEDEMATYFRSSGARVILDFGTYISALPLDELKAFHDYAIETQRRFADAILGNWFVIHPQTGAAGVAELRRCIDARAGFVGYAVNPSGSGLPASDAAYRPFYRVCLEARIPVLVFVGYTAVGAGMPGGDGVELDLCHPRYVDELAARNPELVIVAGRPGWPWQDEMNAVLLHKKNVWAELHGWSPKYFTPALKHEIARRLRHKVMFGADYPMFSYERLVGEWSAEGYSPETLDRVFRLNAEQFLAELAR